MISCTFPIRQVLGHRDVELGAGEEVFAAPRPLYGRELGRLAGLHVDYAVALIPGPATAELVELNRRLDAQLICWVTEPDAIAAERCRLIAEYGRQAFDDAGLDDDDLLMSWVANRDELSRTFVIDDGAADPGPAGSQPGTRTAWA